MKYVLTLIGNPADKALTAGMAERIGSAIVQAGATTGPTDWLAPARAVDIAFDGLSTARALAIARGHIGGLPIDLHAQAVSGRRKRLLIADMDSTIIPIETIDELADRVGKRDQVAAITAAAMADKLDYAESLRERTRLFAGLDVAVLEAVYTERISFNPGAQALVATMNAAGAVTVLASGGFTYFVARVARALGFAINHANKLVIADGTLTGEVTEPIVIGVTKRALLERTAKEHGIDLRATIAIGDGANDMAMLDGAGLGIAYHAKPALAERADMCINHTGLRTPLYLQGFRDAEIVGDD